MKEMTVEVACPLCNEDSNYPYRFEQRFVNKESVSLGLNNCKKCNLQYISPRLNQEAISTLYNEDYLTKTVSGANHVDQTVSIKEYQKFKSYLLKTLPEGGHILDVGCGVGNMLKQIKDSQQFKGSGIEISHDAAERARKDGFDVFEGNLLEAKLKEESFDGVILLYVLEHVNNPLEVLNEINRILKKKGFLFLAVPNYRYLKIAFDNVFSRLFLKNSSIHPEEHLQNFTPVTIRKILQKAGFEIIEENCAKPLAIGNFAARMFKNAMYLFVKTLSVLGYNIGGIHIIARKN